MAVIVLQLDLKLPMQPVPTTSSVVSSNPAVEVYSIQHYVIQFVTDLQQVEWFSLGTPVSPINKTDRI